MNIVKIIRQGPEMEAQFAELCRESNRSSRSSSRSLRLNQRKVPRLRGAEDLTMGLTTATVSGPRGAST